MAVKFSEFTAKLDASVDVTEVVGYLQTGELNVRIPPANLDTTYVVSTGNAGASPTINLQGTKPNQAAAIAPTTVSLTGSGATLLAGNGTTTIDFGSTAYALTSTDSVVGNNSVPVVLTGTGGNDVGTDTVTIVGTGNIQVSSATNVITINGTSSAGVDSFTNVNGTYVSAATVNTNAVGVVTTGVIDLSASDGTSDSTTRFLSKDNTWDVPSYTADTNTTYTLPAGGTTAAATLNLTGSDSSSDLVTLTGGTGITFSSITPAGFTIDATSSAGVDSFQRASGTATSTEGLTITGTASGGVFIGNVTIAVNEFGGNNFVGTVPPASGAGDNTKFLKGDGSWTAALELAGGTMTGVIDMGDDKITNLTDPTAAQDAATKFYVDSSAVGALIYQGAYDATVAPPTGVAVLKGFTYTVTVEGNGSGFWSTILRIGDVIIAEQDNPTAEANWTEVQNNIDIASATIPGIVKFPTGNNQIDIAVDGGATAKIFGNGGDITGGYVPDATSAAAGTFLKKDGTWSVAGTGTVTGTGTSNTLPVFTDGPNGIIGDSLLTQNASEVQVDGLITVLGDTVAQDGRIKLNCWNNTHGVTIQSPPHSASQSWTWILPQTVGDPNDVLTTDGATPSQLSWSTPSSGGYTTEIVAAATTVSAVKDYLYILTNPSTVTITLPASPADGDTIGIANNFVTSGGNVTNKLVAPGTTGNTDKIMGATTDLVIDNGSAAFDLVFSSSSAPTGNGWTIVGAN